MQKYIVIYHAPKGAMEKMNEVSKEETEKGMEPWMNWAKKCGERLLDLGQPLGPTEKVSQSGWEKIDSTIVGYSILQANSMEEAKELLANHPHLSWMSSCEIEIHQALPLPGM